MGKRGKWGSWVLGLTVVAGGALPSTGQAALILQDSKFGTDTLVLDTESGLEWLRLGATSGLSPWEMDTALEGSGNFAGFRWATAGEVHALIGGLLYQTVTGDDYLASLDLMETLGFGDDLGGGTAPSVREALYAPTTPLDPQAPMAGIFGLTVHLYAGQDPAAWWDSQLLSLVPGDDPARWADAAHFVVREVPEPAGMGLLGVGLAMLAWHGRQRRKNGSFAEESRPDNRL